MLHVERSAKEALMQFKAAILVTVLACIALALGVACLLVAWSHGPDPTPMNAYGKTNVRDAGLKFLVLGLGLAVSAWVLWP
jgi:hypothetical protein